MSCHTIRPAPMFKCLIMESHKRIENLVSTTCVVIAVNDVPNFRISHKTIAEAYGEPMGGDRTVGKVFCKLIHCLCITAFDSVSFLDFRNTPSIVDAIRIVKIQKIEATYGQTTLTLDRLCS